MSGFHWLASYPKSGSTWMRLALWSLRHGRSVDFGAFTNWIPMAARRAVFDEMLGIESSDLTNAEIESLRPRVFEALARETAEPILLKVHEAWVLTPAGDPLFPTALTLGAIYIVRDPRDVAVALAHHLGVPLDKAITLMSSPRSRNIPPVPGGFLTYRLLNWSRHVESWLDAPGIRVLPVRYEDMIADLPAELTRVAALLGWTVQPEAIVRSAEATRFDRLRAEEERRGFGEKPLGMDRFFRRGKAGGWRDTLTREQAARIENDHGAVMARLGYV